MFETADSLRKDNMKERITHFKNPSFVWLINQEDGKITFGWDPLKILF